MATDKLALVIMAAGNASRFGKPKQLELVGPTGECLMEYSLYTAAKLGFSDVVIVTNASIQEQIEDRFKPIARICGMELRVVVQPLTVGNSVNVQRKKPWGTGHALLTAAPFVNCPFVLLNADDFYGRESFETAVAFLRKNQESKTHALIAYPLVNTLIPQRKYSRAICETNSQNRLIRLVEHTDVCLAENETITAYSQGSTFWVNPEALSSINCWAFKPSVFDGITQQFSAFLQAHQTHEEAEFFLPSAIESLIMDQQIEVVVFESQAAWFGLTFQEDLPEVQSRIKQLVQQGEYPNALWKQ